MTAPIIPPYLTARTRVARIFADSIARAEVRHDEQLVDALLVIRDQVLDAIGPVDEEG